MAWLLGCAVLLFATSSGIGRYMPAMFSMHMAAHMLLSMLTPILLVLGAPVTLALRALPAAGRGEPPGPREWLLAALHSRVSRFFTNPIVATVLFVAGFYGLYFGGIFDAAVGNHAAHVAMNLHFLLSAATCSTGWSSASTRPRGRSRRWPSWRWCSHRCRCTRSSVWC